MVEVRFAVPGDAPALARVHVQSWKETYRGLMPDDFLESMTSEPRRERRRSLWTQTLEEGQDSVLVAVEDGEVVGFASGGLTDFVGYDAELFTLYLLKSDQGGGTGRALMRELVLALQARGHRSLMLWVLRNNPTRAFYEYLGGTVITEKTESVPGGALREVAYGWPDLLPLAASPGC